MHGQKFWLVLFFVQTFFSIHAQYNFKRVGDVPVIQDGKTLSFPWTGGLNSPQFNTLDFNNDGKNDLVVFDRYANKVYTFLLETENWIYHPEWENYFPKGLSDWMLLRDFNCDGKKDIFTSHPFGVKVFVNTTVPGAAGPSWRSFNNGEALITIGASGPVNLKVNLTDIPAIDDVDGDGDLDILFVHSAGNNTIEFHQNKSKELNNNCDSLQFAKATQRWGNIEDCDCGVFEFTGESCFGSGGRVQHTGGKALVTYDIDKDGDRDLFYSDEFCNSISFLRNEGNNTSPVFTSAIPFNEITKPLFPVAFFEDADGDGVVDCLIGSNLSFRSFYESDLGHSSYRFVGNGSESFQFEQNNFLQDEMIDVGDDAVPAFIDSDADGDLDLFVGNYAGSNSVGTIWFFENTGSATEPAFKLITDDFLNLSSQNLVNIKLAFADVNSDGRRDLVFTATKKSDSQAGIYYFENQSTSLLDLAPSIKTMPFSFIWDERVSFTDFDNDGDIDIIKGTYYGAIQLWLNTGGFQFTLSDKLDYLGSGLDRTNPFTFVVDLNLDGKQDLLIGTPDGYPLIVDDYKSESPSPIKINVLNAVTEEYEPLKLAGRIFPTVARLFGTVIPQIITGTSSGGLILLQSDQDEIISSNPELQIFPNPVSKSEVLNIRSSSAGEISIYNIMGQSVFAPFEIEPWIKNEFDISQLGDGAFIVRFATTDKVIVKRVVIRG